MVKNQVKSLKIILITLILLANLISVAAISFDSDTKYNKDNINFIFKEGLSIKSFDILFGGIIIDDTKYGFESEGGELNVAFYPDDTIGFSSSAPQKLRFTIIEDGIKYHLVGSDETTYVETINIGISEKIFTIIPSESKDINVIDYFKDSTPIERQNWGNRKIFEIEYDTETTPEGIVLGKTMSITNLGALIVSLIIILSIVLRFIIR